MSDIQDPKVSDLIAMEEKRQQETLTLIPSENYASTQVRVAMGSVFSNKYAEGYPGKRYYQGNEAVDPLESLAQERAMQVFKVAHANVQPLSGAPANLAIIKALRQSEEDIQLSQHMSVGGHLSMGQEVSVTSLVMKPVFYYLDSKGEVDWEMLEKLAREQKPRIIWSGGTAYTRIFDWKRYAQIADSVGAYFVADISHIGGLVAGGVHPSPAPYADVIMTTTHKSLRGPRGAMILVTHKGIEKDPELPAKIDKAVFPGVQGGPHMENVAALAVALRQAAEPAFADYSRQIVKNAQALASELAARGYRLVGGGTDNHMIWIDLTSKEVGGWAAGWALEAAGIVANRQTIPDEPRSPYYPSGIRLGTPAVTTRGMKEEEMVLIAGWIDKVLEYIRSKPEWSQVVQDSKAAGAAGRKQFKADLRADSLLRDIAEEVKELAKHHPIP